MKEEEKLCGSFRIRYKERMIDCGFLHVEGVDNTETFAPIVKFMSVRVLLSTLA